MDQPKHQLKINMSELEFAFDFNDPILETLHFLDLETGEVVMTTGEERRILEDVYEQYGLAEDSVLDWATILPELDIPEWQKQNIVLADRVESGYNQRFIPIPSIDSYEGYNDMVDFIYTVKNKHLQSRLDRAIHGRGAFRRFKDVLLENPPERERWFQFHNNAMRERVLDWLESIGIEPIEEVE